MTEREQIEAALDRAVADTFESMVFSEPQLGPAREIKGPVLWARLDADSPLPCTLSIVAPYATSRGIQDVLYAGEGSRPGLNIDVLSELLNTIAGLFLSNLDDTQAIVMGLPAVGRSEAEAAPEGTCERFYDLTEGYVVLRVTERAQQIPRAKADVTVSSHA